MRVTMLVVVMRGVVVLVLGLQRAGWGMAHGTRLALEEVPLSPVTTATESDTGGQLAPSSRIASISCAAIRSLVT